MNDANQNDFNAWLDDLVAGRSTPAPDAPATPDTTGMRAAACGFHRLARVAESETANAATDAPPISTWSTFMHDHAMALPSAGPADSPRRRTGSRMGPWLTGLNVAMAAAIILAMGAGFWRFNENRNGPGGDDQLAFAPETRTFEPDATPETVASLPVIPTADECTVEPLSIDTVLWYYADPGLAETGWTSADAPPERQESEFDEPTVQPGGWVHEDGTVEIYTVTPGVDPLVASPPAEAEPGPASTDQLASMVSLQRMWTACALANSPFQRWALESPTLVAAQLDHLFPTFTSEADAGTILLSLQEEARQVQSGTPAVEFERILWFQGSGFQATVIEPANAETWTLDGRMFWSSYSTYDLRTMDRLSNGDNSELHSYTPVPGAPSSLLPWISGDGNCFWFGFTWYPDRDELLISYTPVCG